MSRSNKSICDGDEEQYGMCQSMAGNEDAEMNS